ncbi:hypothetical protein D7318_30205 [Streptomyces radicis]|nr:hypothetical protein D7318_30205 [Streptomyces radicis]
MGFRCADAPTSRGSPGALSSPVRCAQRVASGGARARRAAALPRFLARGRGARCAGRTAFGGASEGALPGVVSSGAAWVTRRGRRWALPGRPGAPALPLLLAPGRGLLRGADRLRRGPLRARVVWRRCRTPSGPGPDPQRGAHRSRLMAAGANPAAPCRRQRGGWAGETTAGGGPRPTARPRARNPRRRRASNPAGGELLEESPNMPGGTEDATRIHHLFEAHARLAPERAAIQTETTDLTYGELDRAADALARRLRAAGLPDGATVAVRTDRVPDGLVAILGVLKAGGAYAVVDPHEKPAEAAGLLRRAAAVAVVTQRAHRARVDEGGRPVICLDDRARPAPIEAKVPANSAGRAALLFSAGTTSHRRALPATHRTLLAAHAAWAEVYGIEPDDRCLVTAPPDSAAFTGGWIRALCAGATLLLNVRPTGQGLSCTVLDTDPATAARLLARPRGAGGDHAKGGGRPAERDRPPRLVAVSGERLTLAEQVELEELLWTGARVINVYGPAEVAGCGTWFETGQLADPAPDPHAVSYLGRPMPGCGVRIRSGLVWLTPPGGGAAVPTGDLGRQRKGRPLEFRGRAAHRIKVGGGVVHPHEAELALAAHPRIRDAVIIGDTGPGGGRASYLVAHVEPASDARRVPGAAVLRQHLRARGIEERALPDTVVTTDALPRDRAGKVDRGALSLPAVPAAARASGGGKGVSIRDEDSRAVVGWFFVPVIAAVFAAIATDAIWPGSTDLTGVPGPWRQLFRALYVAEWAAFGAGVAFLLSGWPLLARQGKPLSLTVAAHVSLVWLMASWWPQDNAYRLAAKDDWPQQALLVYVFNVPLMIAAVVVAVFAVWRPPWRRDEEDHEERSARV